MTEHGDPSLGILSNDGVANGVGRVSVGNERGLKHKVVSVINANLRFYNRITLDGSTPEGSVVGFDMGIIKNHMRSINGWRR